MKRVVRTGCPICDMWLGGGGGVLFGDDKESGVAFTCVWMVGGCVLGRGN